jgi:hypothetical protein
MHLVRVGSAVIAVSALALGACGSDSGSTGGNDSTTSTSSGGTRISVEGVVTTGSSTPPNDPTAPIPDPGNLTETDISGSVRCDAGDSTGTGVYETRAADVCQQLADRGAELEDLSKADPADRICTEIYGGPQHASITGTVDGMPIDIDVKRTDGCGIDTWQQLVWLLGPPER